MMIQYHHIAHDIGFLKKSMSRFDHVTSPYEEVGQNYRKVVGLGLRWSQGRGLGFRIVCQSHMENMLN